MQQVHVMKRPEGPTQERMRLSVDNISPYLLTRQIVPPEAFVDHSLQIFDYSRRNRNFKVIVPGRDGILLKQAMQPGDAGFRTSVETEAVLLEAIARSAGLKGLRWFSPRFVFFDPENCVLATELVHPATSLTKYHLNLGDVRFPNEGVESSAAILAAFHRLGSRAVRTGDLPAPERRLPPILDALRPPGLGMSDMGPGAPAVIKAFTERFPFLDAAPRARELFVSRSDLVHSDIRWDNLLLTHGAGRGGNLNLRLIDWEFVAVGDGAWDVACFLGEYARFWATYAPVGPTADFDQAQATARFPLGAGREAAAAFLQSYVRRSRSSASRAADLIGRVKTYMPFVLALMVREALQDRDPAATRARLLFDIAMHVFDPAFTDQWLPAEVTPHAG